jgi:hypothetical protein
MDIQKRLKLICYYLLQPNWCCSQTPIKHPIHFVSVNISEQRYTATNFGNSGATLGFHCNYIRDSIQPKTHFTWVSGNVCRNLTCSITKHNLFFSCGCLATMAGALNLREMLFVDCMAPKSNYSGNKVQRPIAKLTLTLQVFPCPYCVWISCFPYKLNV